ncbi:guanine(37)-N1-methyltransferase [Globomyces pollinis-pini]|nr:guanine(37)-N1-methyltransferase [Globomyces pollinis-pini]
MSVNPPTLHKGITTLNRELFKLNKIIGALIVPSSACREAMTTLKGEGILNIPRAPSIIPAPPTIENFKQKRLLLLNPDVNHDNLDALPTPLKLFATRVGATITTHTLNLDYNYWSTEQILRAVLPNELDIIGSFATIGHIAHLNLRDGYEPYKKLIGQVILDKSKHIETVVNKTDTIDHTFRFFSMELLAGKDDTIAQLKESGCRFKFDFAKVYWNSRLQTEHQRLVDTFKKGDIIFDVFAGVGPFAIPAAKHSQCFVFANDLNPSSFEYLNDNIHLNRVGDRVASFNLDGRSFIKQSLELLIVKDTWDKFGTTKKELIRTLRSSDTIDTESELPIDMENLKINHFIMNLPATGLEFLGTHPKLKLNIDSFIGLYEDKKDIIKPEQLPIIHCHCFSKAENVVEDVITRTETILDTKLGDHLITVHNVRNVAPRKEMMCISFRLPADVAFRTNLKRKAIPE